MSGFTLSYRDKWNNPVFRNLLEAGIWAWMCDTAAWKDTKVRFNGTLVNLKRGQLVVSIRFIAKGFGIGEQVTRTFLENLENDGMINTLANKRATIITICNYDKYQPESETTNTPTNTRPTHGQHTANTNKKEDKKIRSKDTTYLNAQARENPSPDFGAISAEVQSIIGSVMPLNTGIIHSWLNAGADPALDIYPTIKRLLAAASRPVTSLKYFDGAVLEAIALRKTTPTLPEVNHETHQHHSHQPPPSRDRRAGRPSASDKWRDAWADAARADI